MANEYREPKTHLHRRLYQVTILEVNTAWGTVRHLSVERRDGKDGISWDVLQRLKDEELGREVCCVEFYPPADQLVNDLNRRHLWEVPEGLELPLKR